MSMTMHYVITYITMACKEKYVKCFLLLWIEVLCAWPAASLHLAFILIIIALVS